MATLATTHLMRSFVVSIRCFLSAAVPWDIYYSVVQVCNRNRRHSAAAHPPTHSPHHIHPLVAHIFFFVTTRRWQQRLLHDISRAYSSRACVGAFKFSSTVCSQRIMQYSAMIFLFCSAMLFIFSIAIFFLREWKTQKKPNAFCLGKNAPVTASYAFSSLAALSLRKGLKNFVLTITLIHCANKNNDTKKHLRCVFLAHTKYIVFCFNVYSLASFFLIYNIIIFICMLFTCIVSQWCAALIAERSNVVPCVCVLVVICDEFDVRVNSHFMYVRFYIIYVLFHDDKGNRKAATTQ